MTAKTEHNRNTATENWANKSKLLVNPQEIIKNIYKYNYVAIDCEKQLENIKYSLKITRTNY